MMNEIRKSSQEVEDKDEEMLSDDDHSDAVGYTRRGLRGRSVVSGYTHSFAYADTHTHVISRADSHHF